MEGGHVRVIYSRTQVQQGYQLHYVEDVRKGELAALVREL